MSEQRPPAHPPIAPASRGSAPDEPWADLRRFTAARIALPRSGASLATAPLLEFRLAHARARDAVHAPFDAARLCTELAPLGLPVLTVASAAQDRQQYLMRPDLGRRLADDAAALLAARCRPQRIRCRVRHRRRLVRPRGRRPRAAAAGRRAAAARGSAHRAAGGGAARPGGARRRGRQCARRRDRGHADRRAARPLRARQHGRLSHICTRRRTPPTPSATASPTSGPRACPTPTPRSSWCISFAPCARAGSRALRSRTTPTGC